MTHTEGAFRSTAGFRTLITGLLLIMASVGAGVPVAADEDEGLDIGDTMPDFAELQATDRSRWSASAFDKATVLIVAFTCNRCPYAVDYEDRLNALHEQYRASSGQVRLLVINSNAGRDESLERMTERSREKKFGFRYVKDEDQSVARSFGAVYTPEFFVFDQERRLAYKGALDDATNADEATTGFVTQAVSAILEGKPVETTEVGARGCTIRFKRRRR